MRIILLNNLYYPYHRGGAEKIVRLTAQGLINLGHQVVIIATQPWSWDLAHSPTIDLETGTKVYYLPSSYSWLNRCPLPLRLIWHFSDLFNVIKYFKIRNILKLEKPDLVWTHNLCGLGYLIPLLIHHLKIKHLHLLHDIQLLHPSGLMFFGQERVIQSFTAKMYQTLTRYFIGQPNLVISPSKWLLDLHRQNIFFLNTNSLVQLNPIRPINPLAIPSRKPDNIFSLLYAGQIEISKGIIFLITTLKQLNIPIDWQLIIAGSGSKMKAAQALAANDPRFVFLGSQTPEQINQLIANCQAVVIPSLVYENSPTIFFEVLNYQKPIIAARLGGLTELITNFSALGFAPNSSTDLNRTIKLVMSQNQTNSLTSIKSEKPKTAPDYVQAVLDQLD